MAERPRATASGGARPAPAAQPPAARQTHSTARVAPTQTGVRRSDLPGWFWGALGCLTVLVVGVSVVFVLGQSGAVSPPGSKADSPATSVPATAAAPSAPARAPDGARGRAGIQVEPMAPPPAAIDQPPPPPPKPRAPIRPIKMARSPAAAKPAGTAKAAAAAAAGDADSDDEPKAKPRAAAPASDDGSEEK